ncbi:hypothetical protein LR48_Vigan03g105000 [Vigna angularis]|uniref:Uncharacterized protein n=1 Tax=Phaseolus angularis TaxID=3914 RepID=A0A0L9U4B5_PHAAN|nr:hypothetical protein LR48_Vigan03g105000 [Vigna angularis]
MKEVEKDRDGIRKELKKCKRRKTVSTAHEHTLALLRGESAAEGRFDFALVPLSGSLPLSGGFKVNLMKEVEKDRDGIRKELKKCKRRKTVSTAHEHTLALLRGESAAEGRFDFALVPLSGSLPLSGGLVSLAGDEANTHLSTPWRKILDAKATYSSF